MTNQLRTCTGAFLSIALWAAPAAAGSITLAWDPAPGATGYIVSYGTQSKVYSGTQDVASVTTFTLNNVAEGERYYFVVQSYSEDGMRSTYSAEVSGFTVPPPIPLSAPRTPIDLDGDARAEIGVWRPGNGNWYLLRSSSAFSSVTAQVINWGTDGDVPVQGDFDGDGYFDPAVYRPGPAARYYILRSTTGYLGYWAVPYGTSGDIPVPADYDGDGLMDVAVWRPSTGFWFVRRSAGGSDLAVPWGAGSLGDVPLPGDYDNDGRADLTIWRPSSGTWYIMTSSSGYSSYVSRAWGVRGDRPLPADFDGDGRMDMVVWRPSSGTWYVLTSVSDFSSYESYAWGSGAAGDLPVLGDYDGDGRVDLTVWRPSNGNWYVRTSSTGFSSYFVLNFGRGSLGDIPLGQYRAQR